MGFASRLDAVKLSEGEEQQRTIALDVGSLVATIRVTDRKMAANPPFQLDLHRAPIEHDIAVDRW